MHVLRHGSGRNRSRRHTVIPDKCFWLPLWDAATGEVVIHSWKSPDPTNTKCHFDHEIRLSVADIATLLCLLAEEGVQESPADVCDGLRPTRMRKTVEALLRLMCCASGFVPTGLAKVRPANKRG